MVRKRDRESVIEAKIQRFAARAEKEGTSLAKFKRTTFSLDEKTNDLIEKLSIKPREFKINRSEVVKAAINHLASLSEEEIVMILGRYKTLES